MYLDNNTTTKLDSRVFEAMRPWLTSEWGNANSIHYDFGQRAADVVDVFRDAVGQIIAASAREVIFTSGATESIVSVLRSITDFATTRDVKVVRSSIEHPAVLRTCTIIQERDSIDVAIIPVDTNGLICIGDALHKEIVGKKCLVTMMLANNEIGTIQPIAEVSALCHSVGALLLCDITQAVGRIRSMHRFYSLTTPLFQLTKCTGRKG